MGLPPGQCLHAVFLVPPSGGPGLQGVLKVGVMALLPSQHAVFLVPPSGGPGLQGVLKALLPGHCLQAGLTLQWRWV